MLNEQARYRPSTFTSHPTRPRETLKMYPDSLTSIPSNTVVILKERNEVYVKIFLVQGFYTITNRTITAS